MTLYIEKPKESMKKLLELINEVSKVAGYEINIQKLVAFLYASNELTERKIKKTIPSHLFKKNKIPSNKANQRSKRSALREL